MAASLIAEAAFMSMVAAVSLARGMDPWAVVRMPATFLVGPGAVEPPGLVPGDVLLGLLGHVWMGILTGLIFAALLPRLGISPITGGLITGAVLYVLGFWVLPLVFPQWLAPFWLPPAEQALEALMHGVYGLVFGISFKRRTSPAHIKRK